ncbi:hydrolase [Rhizorhabdus wittichii DC-6]|nr:hydrolase [Rhizorhabdus wittichii DC-6]
MIGLSASDTALIVVDLQNAVMAQPVGPRSSAAVLGNCRLLAERFRAAGAPVILLNVAFAPDFADALQTPTDRPSPAAKGHLIENWSLLAEGLADPSDIRITKRQWGGFYGTDLDLQLRRRNVRSVVIGGIATNFGVESTARSAHEHGYAPIVVEDACASLTTDMHDFAFTRIFPFLGRVARTNDISVTG